MPIYKLPRYRVEVRYSALAEQVDWGLALNGVPALWKETEGEGVVVAVLDTGIDRDHPDLREAILDARDFSGSRNGPIDGNGHGSHVAGTIAARRNDGGVVGVAPQAMLLIGKVVGDDGSGSDADVARGIHWAIERGARVISMSLGSRQESPVIFHAIKEAFEKGVFVVAAAGNDGPQSPVDYPGRYPGVVTVGSVDRNGRASKFSSAGPEVDVAAPGQDVTSCWLDGGYAKISGTSMATPFVSGAIALMLAKHARQGGKTPIRTPDELREHLARTATDAGPKGHDPQYGFGLVNPAKMLAPLADAPPAGEPKPPAPQAGGVWVFVPGGKVA